MIMKHIWAIIAITFCVFLSGSQNSNILYQKKTTEIHGIFFERGCCQKDNVLDIYRNYIFNAQNVNNISPTLFFSDNTLLLNAMQPTLPEQLTKALSKMGYTEYDITDQLLLLESDEDVYTLYFFSKGLDGIWKEDLSPVDGNVGKNGIDREKVEGDKKTPAGLYPLLSAFGVKSNPGCLLDYRQVTENSYWVDDPNSQYYNQWIEYSGYKDWSSAEHLIDYPTQYAYAVVIGYNTDPIIKGNGSAIFLHCGNSYTAGCISVSEDDMLALLTWLDPTKEPKILIVN